MRKERDCYYDKQVMVETVNISNWPRHEYSSNTALSLTSSNNQSIATRVTHTGGLLITRMQLNQWFSVVKLKKPVRNVYGLHHDLFVVITIPFFPHSWLITVFLTRVTRRMSLVEQELPPLTDDWLLLDVNESAVFELYSWREQVNNQCII
jgi:hypothetical protein